MFSLVKKRKKERCLDLKRTKTYSWHYDYLDIYKKNVFFFFKNKYFLLVAKKTLTLNPIQSASFTIGVIKPPGVATATEMSTVSLATMLLPSQNELASGTSRNANAAATMTKSLTETFTPTCFNVFR